MTLKGSVSVVLKIPRLISSALLVREKSVGRRREGETNPGPESQSSTFLLSCSSSCWTAETAAEAVAG